MSNVLQRLISRKAQAKQHRDARSEGKLTDVKQVTEAKDLPAMCKQGESAHETSPFITNEKGIYHGKHVMFKEVDMMRTLLEYHDKIDEVLPKAPDSEKENLKDSRKQIFGAMQEVWGHKMYQRAVSNYYKFGHILGGEEKE